MPSSIHTYRKVANFEDSYFGANSSNAAQNFRNCLAMAGLMSKVNYTTISACAMVTPQ